MSDQPLPWYITFLPIMTLACSLVGGIATAYVAILWKHKLDVSAERTRIAREITVQDKVQVYKRLAQFLAEYSKKLSIFIDYKDVPKDYHFLAESEWKSLCKMHFALMEFIDINGVYIPYQIGEGHFKCIWDFWQWYHSADSIEINEWEQVDEKLLSILKSMETNLRKAWKGIRDELNG